MAEVTNGRTDAARLAVRVDVLRKEMEQGQFHRQAVMMNSDLGLVWTRVGFRVGSKEIFAQEVLLHSLSIRSWAARIEQMNPAVEERIPFAIESPELFLEVRHGARPGYADPQDPIYQNPGCRFLVYVDVGIAAGSLAISMSGPAMVLALRMSEIQEFARELREEAEAVLQSTFQPIVGIAISKSSGIGVRNEKSLHAALKQYYARPGDRLEAKVDGFVVDIVRDDVLIEIQTRNLAAIRRKLHALLERHSVHLVYPIAKEKWIVRKTGSGKKVIGRRKSPKVGRLSDLFEELVRIPDLINHPNFTLEIVMIQEEEIRHADGRGSWRRKGYSLHDHKLIRVLETVNFEKKEDFLRFLPSDLEQPFSNQILADRSESSIHVARQITYCLDKMGAIQQVGKNGNQRLFKIAA